MLWLVWSEQNKLEFFQERYKGGQYWADDKQSKARNSDGKYRQMALVGFDT